MAGLDFISNALTYRQKRNRLRAIRAATTPGTVRYITSGMVYKNKSSGTTYYTVQQTRRRTAVHIAINLSAVFGNATIPTRLRLAEVYCAKRRGH